MSKIVFTLVLPESKVRKVSAPPEKLHKNKRVYSRKAKHKKDRGEDEVGRVFVKTKTCFSFKKHFEKDAKRAARQSFLTVAFLYPRFHVPAF